MTRVVLEGDQVAIREAPSPKIDKTCQWCDQPARGMRVIVKERCNADGEVVKPAIEAAVCPTHSSMVDRNEEVASLWRRRSSWGKKMKDPDEKKAAKATNTTREIEERLLELGERIDKRLAA